MYPHLTLGAQETVEKHEELPIVSKSKVAFGSKSKGVFFRLHDAVKVHGKIISFITSHYKTLKQGSSRNRRQLLLSGRKWYSKFD